MTGTTYPRARGPRRWSAWLSVSLLLLTLGCGQESQDRPGGTRDATGGADALEAASLWETSVGDTVGKDGAEGADGALTEVSDTSIPDPKPDLGPESGEALPEATPEIAEVLVEASPEPKPESSPEVVEIAEVSDGGGELLDTSDNGPGDVNPSCDPEPAVAADAPRSVFVTHPFGPNSTCGTSIQRLILDEDGELSVAGESYELGPCPKVAAFSPDGRLLIVLTIDNDPQAGTRSAVVYRHHADGSLTQVRVIDVFAKRAIADLAFSPDGKKAYVTDENIEGEGGVHVLDVEPGCDATYSGWIDLHHASSIAVLPGGQHAAVMAGPVYNDDHDIAFVDLEAEAVAARYDRFSDYVTDYSLAAHPDGGSVVVPNASMFSTLANTLTVLGLSYESGLPVPTVLQVVEGVPEPTDVRYSTAGDKLLVTTFSDNAVRWFHVDAEGLLDAGGAVTSVPLADRTAGLSRGPNADLVLVSAVTELFTLRFTDGGLVQADRLDLAAGIEDGVPLIIGDVAVEP